MSGTFEGAKKRKKSKPGSQKMKEKKLKLEAEQASCRAEGTRLEREFIVIDMDYKGSSRNPKTELTKFCQAYCERSMKNGDIVYEHTKLDEKQHQAMVTLCCMEGQQFRGEVCDHPKEAEHSAAYFALKAYKLEISLINILLRRK